MILNDLRPSLFCRFNCLINCISFGNIVTVRLCITFSGSESMHTPPLPHSPHPLPLQMTLTGWNLQGDRVQALGAAISGIVWVHKC